MFSLSWPPVQDTELEQAQAGVSSPLVMTSTPLIMLAKASSSTGSPGRSPIRFMGAGSSELLEFSARNGGVIFRLLTCHKIVTIKMQTCS